MRVTSASARTNSSAAAIASFALCEPVRSEPGMMRIFGAAINQLAVGITRRVRSRQRQSLRYTQTRAGGRFIQIRSDASVDTPGSDFGIGGTTAYVNCTKGAPGAGAVKATR